MKLLLSKLAISRAQAIFIAVLIAVAAVAVFSGGISTVQAREGGLTKVMPNLAPESNNWPFSHYGPSPVIFAAGTPYQMGYQIGWQEAKLSPDYAFYTAGKCFNDLKAYGTKQQLIPIMQQAWDNCMVANLGSDVSNDFWQEMVGFADGWNANGGQTMDVWDVLITNYEVSTGWFTAYLQFYYGTGPVPVGGGASGETSCSSFFAWGDATRNGKMIIGMNDDSIELPGGVILVKAPSKGHAYVGVTLGALTVFRNGMNDAGVWIASLGTDSDSKVAASKMGIPEHFQHAWILQYADTAQDAFNMWTQGTFWVRGYNGNLEFADPKNVILATGASNNHWIVWSLPENGKDYTIMTNHTVPSAAEFPYLKTRVAPTMANGNTNGSYARYYSHQMIVNETYGHIDLKKAVAEMSSHYVWDLKRDGISDSPYATSATICRHSVYSFNYRSVGKVMIPADKLFYATAGSPCSSDWIEVKIGSKAQIALEAAVRMHAK